MIKSSWWYHHLATSNPSLASPHLCFLDDVVIGWCNACNAWCLPVSGLGRGAGDGLGPTWLEPEGQVVIPDWLTGADHTHSGYIPWSPGHRLSSLSTILPSGARVLCHLERCIPCVPSPWTGVSSQPTLLTVKWWYNQWRHRLEYAIFYSRPEKDILDFGGNTKIAWTKSPRAASSWSQQSGSVREGEAEASSGLRLTLESST